MVTKCILYPNESVRIHPDPRRPRPQSQGHLALPPTQPVDGHHGRLRLRQILPRLRHHLRRRPAPLRRVPLRLRPPIPRAMEKPAVEDIDGIAPAIAIRQKNTSRNPRSTVATSTECYDFLRLLFARVGRTFCPNAARASNATRSIKWPSAARPPAGSRWYALFPVAPRPARNQALRDHLSISARKVQPPLSRRPHIRILHPRIAARYRFLDSPSSSSSTASSSLPTGPDLRQRMVDAVEIGYREAGEIIFEPASGALSAILASARSSPASDAASTPRSRTPPVQLQ